jgi:AraC-like DNA-binding protein
MEEKSTRRQAMIPDHISYCSSINAAPNQGELAVLFSGDAQPVPGHYIGPAVHDYYLVHTVLSGEGTYETAGKQYKCMPGDTFVIFPGVLFRYEAGRSNPWHYTWVAFVGRSGEKMLSDLGITPEQPVINGSGGRKVCSVYRRLIRSLLQTDYPVLADLEAAGWLRVLLSEFGMANRGRLPEQKTERSDMERQVDRAIRWLTLQYAQPVSIEGMAHSLGYHRTHLSKMFKQTTGLSPMQFLLKIRMERAQTLLATNLTIHQVASSVGYPDALYFSKLFRKWCGHSPSEYREALKERAAHD